MTRPARQAGALDIITVCALGLAGAGIQAHADQLPLWEVGVGVAALSLPDYPGADERTNYVFPLPFFVYRGDVFKIDRDGVRGLFFKTDAVELDVSVNASAPVKSDNNQARLGMRDLDPTLEIGPTLNFTLYRGPTNRSAVQLRLPVRGVIATDFRYAQWEGVVFQPQLTLDLHRLTPLSGWRAGVAAGPMFGDSRYNSYYYSVAPADATPSRPAYSAPGGYTGTQLLLSTSRRFPSFWVGAYARWQQLSGAVFEDSPLVKRQQALSFGFAVAWVFKRSSTLVEADD
jgi:outer membrane scaffolding protein for murein synthesis (MipA/OmpV family)